MPFVTSKEMIMKAQQGKYAVPAFNAENMEMIQAIISAAEEAQSPVMIQTTPTTVKYIGLKEAYHMILPLAEKANVPVALHLDHSESFDDVMKAIHGGYTSLMIDGSKHDFEKNIEITRKVVEVAHPMGIPVEAELGRLAGKEDGLEVKDDAYTDPKEAKIFAEQTGVDMLAVSIGTAHGFYKGEPKLDFERLEEIRNILDTPLVLHGASGLLDDQVRKAITLGVCKVNFATELRAAATLAVREVLKDESIIDPKKYMSKARQAVKELCLQKIAVCGSNNKA